MFVYIVKAHAKDVGYNTTDVHGNCSGQLCRYTLHNWYNSV